MNDVTGVPSGVQFFPNRPDGELRRPSGHPGGSSPRPAPGQHSRRMRCGRFGLSTQAVQNPTPGEFLRTSDGVLGSWPALLGRFLRSAPRCVPASGAVGGQIRRRERRPHPQAIAAGFESAGPSGESIRSSHRHRARAAWATGQRVSQRLASNTLHPATSGARLGLLPARRELRKEAVDSRSPCAETIDCPVIEVIRPDAGLRHVIPSSSLAPEEEWAQGRIPENLLHAGASIVEPPSMAGRIGGWLDDDLQVRLVRLRLQIHIHHDAEQRLNLAGDHLKRAEHSFDPDDLSTVVLADPKGSALGMGKATDPIQVVVLPVRLSLDSPCLRCQGRGLLSSRIEWVGEWNRRGAAASCAA